MPKVAFLTLISFSQLPPLATSDKLISVSQLLPIVIL